MAKFEGHSQNVSMLKFVQDSDDYSFLSCAGNECLLWQIPDLVPNKITEVLQPAKILDIESSSTIKQIEGF
jgi:hypothetical protein